MYEILFLNMAITLANLNLSETVQLQNEELNKISRHLEINFKILVGILNGPVDFLSFNFDISHSISEYVTGVK